MKRKIQNNKKEKKKYQDRRLRCGLVASIFIGLLRFLYSDNFCVSSTAAACAACLLTRMRIGPTPFLKPVPSLLTRGCMRLPFSLCKTAMHLSVPTPAC
jgi:hypothetical protein